MRKTQVIFLAIMIIFSNNKIINSFASRLNLDVPLIKKMKTQINFVSINNSILFFVNSDDTQGDKRFYLLARIFNVYEILAYFLILFISVGKRLKNIRYKT